VTAGDIVFEGNSAGVFSAYDARTGALLWSSPAYTGIIAAPMSYSVKGEQYVAIVAGWGGGYPISAERSHSRVLNRRIAAASWRSSSARPQRCRSLPRW